MDAIVFSSNTGFTEQYAKMLSGETGLPVYNLKEAKGKLNNGAKVIYLGWLMASKIKGLNKAKKIYDVCAVCGVGMSADDSQLKEMIKSNGIADTQTFLLQGGFDMNKLHGVYKFMMQMMKNFVGKKLAEKPDKTAEELDMLDLLENGGSRVSIDKLAPVLTWLSANKTL